MEPDFDAVAQCIIENDYDRLTSLLLISPEENPEGFLLDRYPQLLFHVDSDENTLLHLALLSPHLSDENSKKIIKSLLRSGSRVGPKNKNGDSPLKLAVQSNNNQILDLFGEWGGCKDHNLHHTFLPQNEVRASFSPLDYFFLKKGTPDPFFFHYEARESPLTTLLRISHFDTIYNMFTGVFVLYIIYVILANFHSGTSPLHFELLFSSFGQPHIGFACWLILYALSFSVVLYENLVAKFQMPSKVAYLLEAATIILMNYIACFFCLNVLSKPPPLGTTFVIMAECCRLNMKMHAYMMTNMRLRNAKARREAHPSVDDYPENLTVKDYFLFTWMPTLIYQTRYPRLKGPINWGRATKHFIDFAMSVTYAYTILDRFIYPQLVNCVTQDYFELLLTFFSLCVPGIFFALLAFFGLLHSWFSAWAELTRFADQWFYSDWWNVRSMAAYYRRWNAVVHNFLHRYVYQVCLENGVSKFGSMAVVFLFSAVIHEYLISVAMGFWKPVLTILFVGPGLFYIWLTNHFAGWKGWNIFFWANLIIGHGILASLYGRAWILHWYMPESLNQSPFALINPIA